jgi:hypothetical protein
VRVARADYRTYVRLDKGDEEAVAANKRLNGNKAKYFATCLIGLIRTGALDRSDQKLVAELRELCKLLQEWLAQS